jgi:ubiquinone/menaquinone biosynthesis C-methylase UbiE
MNYTKKWDKSYMKKQNFIYYPKEEVVKFINRFVRKRTGFKTFQDILGSNLKALDLGCGIGRQTILFQEFKINGWGVDISSMAIREARMLARSLGFKMDKRFSVIDDTRLSFENDFFDFAISDSALDSMPFDTAREYMKELDRTVTRLLYVSLISGDCKEIEVITDHEKGTIQSYFNVPKIAKLIEGTNWNIKQMKEITEIDLLTNKNNNRYHIVLFK